MTRTFLDINILQTVPPSNLNRDDTGSPKTATYGGTRRARVSSQAWKRAARAAFREILPASALGVRTKRVVEVIGRSIVEQDPAVDTTRAHELAALALSTAKIRVSTPRKSTAEDPLPDETGYLLFLSAQQITNVAALCVAAQAEDSPEAYLKTRAKEALDTEHSVDLALFGRMVADATDLNVDAACQVAHAISVHPVDNEYDYFTAVDDEKAGRDDEDAGAGMIGTVEFNASTLYRYATIDVDALQENLGEPDATRLAVEAFVRAFVTSMPTGKQNTFANRTLPDAVYVALRSTQPVNLVGAYEEAIDTVLRLRVASENLARLATDIDANFGTTPEQAWVVRTGAATAALDTLGTRASLDEAIFGIGEAVATRLSVE